MIFDAFKRTLDHVFNILHETDEPGTIREINEKIPIRGNNTWMLMCSAMLASIGLDTGSGAVIIGAMLVSPLMSPILGVGLSVGINDREMLIASLKNLGVAALAGLIVSTLYFKVTPLGEPTNELLARTQPTLLDVMVAFFGGLAGIVSISRSDKSNAIPGVAIATALMPPLCTAGYGLALGRLDFFFGGFYLFFINAVFISLATFLIVKYLKFHTKDYINKDKEKKVARIMAVMLVIVVLPSVYFLYNIYQGVQTRKKIESLIISDFASRNNEIIKWEIQEEDTLNYIKIYSVGNTVEDNLVGQYNEVLQKNSLENYKVRLVQLDVSAEDVQRMATDLTNNLTRDFLKTLEIQKLQAQRADSVRAAQSVLTRSGSATEDLKLLFPEIQKVQIGDMVSTTSQAKADTITLVMIDWKLPAQAQARNRRQVSATASAKIEEFETRISTYLSSKLKSDSLQIMSTINN
ncbi:TIGR00341 family protein [Pontibacter silvestris]|uniref:TIGR00341 family protein n=1 Tax=Pontibacter silvestris TaxID=2305183 RepID=A0ABW4WXD9_9BACT|nr:TIGR00341 family protein [Pontibacter silvestris]MCC9137364.1 TIGR00341 family protein [Pontibacter silvestris]